MQATSARPAAHQVNRSRLAADGAVCSGVGRGDLGRRCLWRGWRQLGRRRRSRREEHSYHERRGRRHATRSVRPELPEKLEVHAVHAEERSAWFPRAQQPGRFPLQGRRRLYRQQWHRPELAGVPGGPKGMQGTRPRGPDRKPIFELPGPGLEVHRVYARQRSAQLPRPEGNRRECSGHHWERHKDELGPVPKGNASVPLAFAGRGTVTDFGKRGSHDDKRDRR